MSGYAGRGLHGQTVERIGARIVRGDYQPGDTLFADELEHALDVSKTVVREALKVLAAKGLVESRQKRGTVVRPRQSWSLLDSDVLRWQGESEPDFDFLEHLAEVRGVVEPAGARLAAQRRGEDDVAELDDALAAMIAAGADTDATVAADVRFHRALLKAAHNPLLEQLDGVLGAGLQMRDRFVHNSQKPADAIRAHRSLLEAVRDGDADLAAQTVEELLAQSSRDLERARRQAEGSSGSRRQK